MSGVAEVSWEQALAWRMKRQHLLERAALTELSAVVGRLCGLHAQLMSSVELALWARTDGLIRDDVRDALWRQRTLVKLWAMRGTLHVLPASDLGPWLSGLGCYRQGYDMYGMRNPLMLELAGLVGRALHGELLTRAELAAAVGRLNGSAATEEVIHGSWGSHLKPASYLGQLCFGPSEGQRVRFTHPATWLHTAPELSDADDALATIAERYLAGYGPAASVDLGPWWGVNGRQAQRMLAALGEVATEVRIDGRPYWMAADQVADLQSTPTTNVVRLLPAFDQWVVGASRQGRSRPGPVEPALDPAHRTRVYRRQGWVSPVVLVNGRMEGVWKHQRNGRKLQVEIESFRRLPRWARQPIEAEAERLAGFLGGELHLVWTD